MNERELVDLARKANEARQIYESMGLVNIAHMNADDRALLRVRTDQARRRWEEADRAYQDAMSQWDRGNIEQQAAQYPYGRPSLQ